MFDYKRATGTLNKHFTKVEQFVGLSVEDQYESAPAFMRVMCKELGIEPVAIFIGLNLEGCCYTWEDRRISLNPHQINKYNMSPLVVLSHELRHAWQIDNSIMQCSVSVEKGRWGRYNKVSFMWKNEPVHDVDDKRHHQPPWEQDAIEYERYIAERIGEKPLPRHDLDLERIDEFLEKIERSA